jgi:hypothetical protein
MAGRPRVGGARPGSGRKKLPASRRKSITLWASVTKAEAATFRRQARELNMKLQDWIRMKLLTASVTPGGGQTAPPS